MARKKSRKVAFLGSYLPQKCGIATFTNDLITNAQAAGGDNFEPLVVAMKADDSCQYAEPVKFEIRPRSKNDYICAADYLNFSHVDLISIQHEFGLFGGDAGSYLNLLLHRVKAPVITTLHTVLKEPDEHYYQSMVDVCQASEKIVVMNGRGVTMLKQIYDVPEKKIELLPHGIPDLPFVDSSYYKAKYGMENRRTILTFGLLSKNKGIEVMLRALPAIVKVDPSILYIVLGRTHPSVVKHDGESYRFGLQRLVKELGLSDNVIFHNHFVSDEELNNFLCAADLYVTPYTNREQLTSGTLAFAVGTGKAVVSTPYWAAEELLSDGRGRIFDFDDSEALSASVIEILNDDRLFFSLRRKAYEYGREIIWPVIGKQYWKLFSSRVLPGRVATVPKPIREDAISILEVPEPPLDHLQRMTDDTGLYQHAKFIIPDRRHGYCTDDNTRAVVAMAKYYRQYAEPEALRLFDIYLSFVIHAQNEDGSFRNFMDFDRTWIPGEPAHDSIGRALWAFGSIMPKPPLPRYLPIIKDYFDKTVKHVPTLSIRGKAYSIFGMADYLQQFPGASAIKRYLTIAADSIVDHYQENAIEEWQWFEKILTYDNAVLPDALFIASTVLDNEKYFDIAKKTCDFLLDKTYTGEHFSYIGCKGWYQRDHKRAKFDQQPLEVACTTMMLKSAYNATRDAKYLQLQRKAFDWFLGDNDLNLPVYDFRTKGSADGLEAGGININQGAESLLSFLLSLLCVLESYPERLKLKEHDAPFPEEAALRKTGQTEIKDVASRNANDQKTADTTIP